MSDKPDKQTISRHLPILQGVPSITAEKRWPRRQYIHACCLIVFLCSVMVAQDHPSRGTMDVPFDFYVAGNNLPAGEYTLEIVVPTYVTLRSKDGKRQQDLYFMQTA